MEEIAMNTYNNPNDVWSHTGYDPYRGMNDDERMKAGCFQMAAFIITLIGLLAVFAIFH